MPVIDINDPAIIKFLIENYEKTAYLRMRWNHLNRDKLKQTATLTREEKGYYVTDVLKETMAAGMATITRDYASGARNRKKVAIRDAIRMPVLTDLKKGHSIVDIGLGTVEEDPRLGRPDTDVTIDPVMRLMDSKQRKIIYKGIPEFGRKVYLKSRNKLAPEDRYYFRQSMASACGWRLKDSFFGRNAPEHGRVWQLTHGTASRSGPQRDPDHYKEVASQGANKCS